MEGVAYCAFEAVALVICSALGCSQAVFLHWSCSGTCFWFLAPEDNGDAVAVPAYRRGELGDFHFDLVNGIGEWKFCA